MNLFGETSKSSESPETQTTPFFATGPLANRMRPTRLEEFFGQGHLVGQKGVLRRAIEADEVVSFILWGPPGSGKTTLAQIVANHTNRRFITLSAVMSGVKDIKEAVADAEFQLRTQSIQTLLFVDEIHRFNKSQQDALLPFVENGTVTLIGATTENPGFELNSALLSRAPVYRLLPLTQEDLVDVLKRALLDATRGLGRLNLTLPDAWLSEIAFQANGDARKALTLLESISEYAVAHRDELMGEQSLEILKNALAGGELGKMSGALRYDANGEEHHNTISAFIKSMRASDPQGAVYYLARMLEGGEDPLFIVRRMVVFASEDVGNADPRAFQMAIAAKDAVDFVGMPECRINLSQTAIYLAIAPKSRASYNAIGQAIDAVKRTGNLEIPYHLRNYPPKDRLDQSTSNLPAGLENQKFYQPSSAGLEGQITERLKQSR